MNRKNIKLNKIISLFTIYQRSVNFSLKIFFLLFSVIFLIVLSLSFIRTVNKNKAMESMLTTRASAYPSSELVMRVIQLDNSSLPQTPNEENERFRVSQNTSDRVLLQAPKAACSEKVVGIVLSTSPTNSMAIIEKLGKQRSYQQGDRLSDQYTIIKIFKDRVIINDNGYYAALIL